MREGWEQSTLGQVADINPEKTPAWADEQPIRYVDIASVNWGRPIEANIAPQPFGTAPGRARRRIRTGDVLASTVRPNLHAVGVVPAELDGEVASTGFAVLRAKTEVALPGFVWAIVSHTSFRDGMASKATGSNYPAVRASDVASHPILLPPLPEQRRIVDLIGALDDTIEAAENEQGHLEAALVTIAGERLPAPVSGGEYVIADLLTRSIGGVWGKHAGEGAVDAVAFRSTEFSNWGHVVHKEPAVRGLTLRELETRRLRPDDILIEKSGGTPQRPVGRVVQFHEHDLPSPAIGTNFMQIVTPDASRVHPRFLFWVLWSTHRRGGSVLFQQASTNIRNLQTKAYLGQRIDLPEMHQQQEVAQLLDQLLEARRHVASTAEQLRALRSDLLTALLSGEHEIPESYDELIEEVAA